MTRLPVELVHRILEYDGRIKYRHGKYMNQICKDDYRSNFLVIRNVFCKIFAIIHFLVVADFVKKRNEWHDMLGIYSHVYIYSLVMSFSSLPTDIVHHILSYNENMKLRNGKYMGQISKSDKRYDLLGKISRDVLQKLGYQLYVTRYLTIRIIIYHFSTTIVEYEYYFSGSKTPIYYRPK
jgi:hypothetical protein